MPVVGDDNIEKESSVNEADQPHARSSATAFCPNATMRSSSHRSAGVDGIGDELVPADDLDPKEANNCKTSAMIRSEPVLQQQRNDAAFERGNFRVRGDSREIFRADDQDGLVTFSATHRGVSPNSTPTGKKGATSYSVRCRRTATTSTPGPTMK